MQCSELFRRGIVLPLDENAINQLNNDAVKEDINVRVIDFDGDEDFFKVWETGVFSVINSRYSRMIDDYENEKLDCNLIDIETELLSFVVKYADDSDLKLFFDDFLNIYNEAKKNRMPLYFIF